MVRKAKTQSLSATPAPPTKKMTYEEFLAWADEDTWAEWVDGEVLLLTPASNKHRDLAGFLAALLRLFAEAHQAGTVITAPFQMKTALDLPGREPDILFIAREHTDRLQDAYMDGPADLVVEIISPDSRTRDRRRKFGEYQRGGVREYWLLDPLRKRAEFYQRGNDGLYRQIPIGDDGILHSAVLAGLWLRVAWLWQEPLPLLMDVLREWGLV
jgi:Uma2 family endonuclease